MLIILVVLILKNIKFRGEVKVPGTQGMPNYITFFFSCCSVNCVTPDNLTRSGLWLVRCTKTLYQALNTYCPQAAEKNMTYDLEHSIHTKCKLHLLEGLGRNKSDNYSIFSS